MGQRDPLDSYRSRRDFTVTGEPEGGGPANERARSFVIQKHWAKRLHYDLRLELGGVMKSWAVPKGPSYDVHERRMAVHVEDHPISYNTFEGEIPEGEYGAGKVIIWDRGVWTPLGDPYASYERGRLKFELLGQKLQGRWTLVRMGGRRGGKDDDAWLLIKEKDMFARPASEFSVVDEMPDSVVREETGVSPAPLPARLEPQLATLASGPPPDSREWIYEIKFDGYRLLARVEGGAARLYTRSGHDWTARLDGLRRTLDAAALPDGWYDGEIIVQDDQGLPDFQALQRAFESPHENARIVYYLFDLPYSEGLDLRRWPLIHRRRRLQEILAPALSETIRFSETFDAHGRDIVASACGLGLEGVIGKQRSSHYVSGRTDRWIKLKCGARQEFVIGGYTEPRGSRVGIGALLVGVHDQDGVLRYAGKVGTGFDERKLQGLGRRLAGLQRKQNPFVAPPPPEAGAHWVDPVLVAEVSFTQWTRSGRIRHAVFHGLRKDKPARTIIREVPMPPSTEHAPSALISRLKITHGDRLVDESTGLKKIDVLRYYALVAPLMMAHLKSRPVSLLRAPEGVAGEKFFQKHMETTRLEGLRTMPPEMDPGHESLMEITGPQGLLTAGQMNVIEFHTWNAVRSNIHKPDRMIFDLDPGKGVEWPAVQEAALVLHAFLKELELPCFLKTSGGQGLHVVVPLKRTRGWDVVKGFSHAVVTHLARTFPKRFSDRSGPRNRVGKIFIDYLRNGYGATTVSAWSARARPGMGVSVPVHWKELDALHGGAHWHVGNVHTRLDQGNQPWEAYAESARTLTRAMDILDFRS